MCGLAEEDRKKLEQTVDNFADGAAHTYSNT